MQFPTRFLLLAAVPALMAFTPALPGEGTRTQMPEQVISTCAMPTGLRSLGPSNGAQPVIYLVRDGARYDLEFAQGPLGTWRLSDGGTVRQAGSPQQFLQLSADDNQFLYAAGKGDNAVLNWLGPDGKRGKAACIAHDDKAAAQDQQASGY